LSGESVEAILVDVCPHSLGVAAAIDTPLGLKSGFFSVIIPRNSVVPVSRSEVYSTVSDNQLMVEIDVFQGENVVAEENVPLGSFTIDNLPPRPAGTLKIEVHFDFDLSGMLTVTATEKGLGNQSSLVVNNASIHRLSTHELTAARAKLDALFTDDLAVEAPSVVSASESELRDLQARSQALLDSLDDPDEVSELEDLIEELRVAMVKGNRQEMETAQSELADFLYYATSNSPTES
jgi:molecular chaperone DnaK